MDILVNVKQIVNEIEAKEDICFTSVERKLLEIAVLKGAMAMLDNERKEIKELTVLRAKLSNTQISWIKQLFKPNWIVQLFKGIKS